MVEWNRENYDASVTRTCFSSTPYDTGWDGAPQWNIGGSVLQNDPEMRRLLELEWAIRPVPVWAQKVARQIEEMAPCGWCFPQCIRAICQNIGADDAAAASPCGCYVVGEQRLHLMASYAVCLDAWLKGATPEAVGQGLSENAGDERNWLQIATDVSDVLSEHTPQKLLLVRRLLARLRFWLRAPFGNLKRDDNWRLGYFYTHSMGRYGAWDYFSLHYHDSEFIELDGRLRAEAASADRWLELIDCTWPCAPKVFRYLERIMLAIGSVSEGCDATPDDLANEAEARPILQLEGTYLDTEKSRGLFDTAIGVLTEFVADDFPASGRGSGRDRAFGTRLKRSLADRSPQRVWLAALLLKRISLFEASFKSLHFTRNAHQVW